MKKFLIPLIAIILINLTTQAQIVQKPLPQDTTKAEPGLRGQYQFMISKSKTLNGYKLINPARLSSFWKNITDTLATNHKQFIIANNKIAALEKDIMALKSQISGTQTSLATSNAKLDEISFLGISFSKSNYNLIVWSLIIILGLALTFVIIRSAKHIHEAKYRGTLYEEISQEYQSHKVKANEKEKKLARELQDERNKLDELKNKGR